MNATIIVATDINSVIGNRPDPSQPGETPWQGQLPADMAYFQEQTTREPEQPVVFARLTYKSIPEKLRPLKKRTNVVWTRQKDLFIEGATVVHSLDQAFEQFPDQELMICGGGQIYKVALQDPRVDMVLRTLVHGEFDGNIYFPKLSDEWVLIHSDSHKADEKNCFDYSFETYVRRDAMIVDPRNGRTEEYKRELLKIQRARMCPFCSGGKTLVEGKDPIIAENSHWIAINSHTPVKNCSTHWVIFPKEHITRLTQLHSGHHHLLNEILRELQGRYGISGGAMYIREGDTKITGATVCHVHYNYIVPDVNADETPRVFFGQYKKP